VPGCEAVRSREGTTGRQKYAGINPTRVRLHMSPLLTSIYRSMSVTASSPSKVLPFGLTNGPATYQQYMNDVLFKYLNFFCTAYLDDILIYSDDPLTHQEHVNKVLQRLRDADLQANIQTCKFGVTRTIYLGFIISVLCGEPLSHKGLLFFAGLARNIILLLILLLFAP